VVSRTIGKMVLTNKVYFSLPIRDLHPDIEGAVQLEALNGMVLITQLESSCVICGNIAVQYLFGKGVCAQCLKRVQPSNKNTS